MTKDKVFLALGASILVGFGCLVVWVGNHRQEQRMSVEEICMEIDKIPPGDVEAFKSWLGPQWTHVVNPTDVAACLFAKLP